MLNNTQRISRRSYPGFHPTCIDMFDKLSIALPNEKPFHSPKKESNWACFTSNFQFKVDSRVGDKRILSAGDAENNF
jgi:hypothetical protein